MESRNRRPRQSSSVPLSNHCKVKVSLVWMKAVSSLYKPVSSNVLREVCQYLHFRPLLAKCLHTKLIVFDPLQQVQYFLKFHEAGVDLKYFKSCMCAGIGDDQIFLCGGSMSLATDIIALRDTFVVHARQAVPLQGMRQGRSDHALYFHEASQRVFVFGGLVRGSEATCTCEQYGISRGEWAPTQSMRKARYFFLASGHREKVFLCGTMIPFLEVFAIPTQEFSVVPVPLALGVFPTCAIPWKSELIVIQSKTVRRWSADSYQLLAESELEYSWTVTDQTLVLGDLLFAFNPELVSFDLGTLRKVGKD